MRLWHRHCELSSGFPGNFIQCNGMRFLSGRVFLGIAALAGFWLFYWGTLSYLAFLNRPINWPNPEQILKISSGDSVSRLSRRLEKQQVISSRYWLRMLCEFQPQLKQIKQGEYKLEGTETPLELMSKLASGKVIQHPFQIIEGSNSYQLLAAIKNQTAIVQDLALTNAEIAGQLGILEGNIEGWIYPDTYYYHAGDKASELLKRGYAKMQSVLNQAWSNRSPDLPYATPYQALIMASIVEKETAIASEREQIAAVFVGRLNKNMRLQTDPTVIYGIGPEFNGDITRRDLKNPTPYNTYQIKGLPPTPIAMPSEASIEAALNPAKTKALYFVADGRGGHVFSETLQEHNQAVQRYLKTQRN